MRSALFHSPPPPPLPLLFAFMQSCESVCEEMSVKDAWDKGDVCALARAVTEWASQKERATCRGSSPVAMPLEVHDDRSEKIANGCGCGIEFVKDLAKPSSKKNED